MMNMKTMMIMVMMMSTESTTIIMMISGVSRVCLRGGSKGRKCKWVVKAVASEGVTP